jgi:hypothetical protein
MKKIVLIHVFILVCTGIMYGVHTGSAFAQVAHDAPIEMIVLSPGDARSVEYEFDNTLGQPDSYNVALIAALAPDQEIHQLAINITPRGDMGPEVAYFTWGIFFSFTGGIFDFVEMLDPKYTYGFNTVNYDVDINPYLSFGLIFSAATTVFSSFDFPLEMTLTLTLSN